MSIKELIERFMKIDILDDLNESVQTIAERIAKDYVISIGRPTRSSTVPNYCVRNAGDMAQCAAAVNTKIQVACHYYIKHSYEPKCRSCDGGFIKGHCDNAEAQVDTRAEITTLVPYSNEEIQQAWEEVVYQRRIGNMESKEKEISL